MDLFPIVYRFQCIIKSNGEPIFEVLRILVPPQILIHPKSSEKFEKYCSCTIDQIYYLLHQSDCQTGTVFNLPEQLVWNQYICGRS